MDKKQLESFEKTNPNLDGKQEIDYSPKTYSAHDQLIFLSKFIAVGALIFLIVWLVEAYLPQ